MRWELIQWLRGDGYTRGVDGDAWRVYPQQQGPVVDQNPDHGLPYQETREVVWALPTRLCAHYPPPTPRPAGHPEPGL